MKLTLLAPFSLIALAAAQSTTTAPTLSPEASCAAKCGKTDICCTAACFKVPCPNTAMANDTNSCVAACPQGSGTPADATAYASCEQSCFSSHFFPATPTAGAATTTGKSGSAATTTGSGSGSGSGSSAAGSQASGSGSPTASGSGAAASSTSGSDKSNAANRAEIAVSAAGLFGVLAAALAL